MKWNEAIAIAIAVIMGIIFLIVPLFSLVFDVAGITEDDPKFSAYNDDYWDISHFIEDVENYNCQVPGSIFYNGKGNNDGAYDYEVKSMVSTPTLLLGDLVDPEKSIYLAVGVERSYTQEEIRALRSFLARGGHAIIADDFGNANQIAKDYGVTYYGGQFYDENFDTNVNYTLVNAHMGSDLYDVDGVKVWSKDKPFGDGVWDDDQDADGRIDEDDNTGSSRNYDDDRDNADLQKNLRDDDNDGVVDEENEGFDEDPIDDDVVFTPGGDAENRWYGHVNVDLEWLNGMDDDDDGLIDEDLQSYELITYKPTGLFSSVNPWIWAAGSSKSFIDMDGNGILSIPTSGDLKGKNADEVSSVGNELQFCIEIPVADDGTGAVDVISGESQETIKEAESQAKKYQVRELNPEADKLITELGSIVFISDPSIFMNDLYSLNHIRYDVNLPWDPEGNGEDDDGDGLIDEDREILRETGDVDIKDIEDRNNLADNSPDYWSESDVEKFPWLSEEMAGRPKLDYDNQQFLLDLIHHLCPAEEGDTNLIIIDESRHSQSNHFLKPVYKTMEVTGFLTSSPYYAYPIIFSIGFLLILTALMVRDKESWAHNFDISLLVPRKAVPLDNRLQTTKLRLALKEKVRFTRGLSPEEFATLSESIILNSIRDPELIELLQNIERTYTSQELQRMMEKIKKIQNI
ncbi:MAG: hypothetical protein JXA22_04365 [Candidatus Thermoplasmatota archaeon]|nr:hypothetical protein [Candidatus Thermoplasmatota archaeon]